MSNLYNKIEQLCSENSVNVTEMCRKSNVSRGNLTDLKNGRQTGLSPKNLDKIADYFGVPIDFLLERPPFDCWDLINQNRKGFLCYVDINPDTLKMVFGIDPENPENVLISTFVTFIAAAIESATPTSEGDWVVGVRPIYRSKKEKAPALTEKDERDIAKNLDKIMDQLEHGGDLMFDGDPMSDEARESIKAAMKLGLEAAKAKNKARFTPKKYRKE